MGRLGRRRDTFCARELQRGLEGAELRHRYGLDDALIIELADERRHAVVAQATGVHGRRHERVAEGMHLHQRCHAHCIAKVVHVLAFRKRRAGRRLDSNEAQRRFEPLQLVRCKGEGEPGEVGATSGTANDDVRLVLGQYQLLLGFQADHGLVHQDMIEHAAQRVFCITALRRVLHGLTDGNTQTPW